MRKFLIISGVCFGLTACNSGGIASTSTDSTCPSNAPLFTQELGIQLISNWGKNVSYYSPLGGAGYTDVYVGAAYFTGAQYLPNATLLPTMSAITRSGSQEIYDYFTNFLAHNPQMTNDSNPQDEFVSLAECGSGVISGYYDFDYSDGTLPTNARYTFEFQYLANPDTISIQVESGPESGSVINIKQPAGWYIDLQNSAKLPSTTGLPENLLVH